MRTRLISKHEGPDVSTILAPLHEMYNHLRELMPSISEPGVKSNPQAWCQFAGSGMAASGTFLEIS